MRRLDSITDSMDMNLGNLWEMVRDRDIWHSGRKQQSHRSLGNPPGPKERTSILGKRRTLKKPISLGSQRVEYDLANEQQQQQPIFGSYTHTHTHTCISPFLLHLVRNCSPRKNWKGSLGKISMSIITGDQDTVAFLMVHTGDCAVHGHHQFQAFQWGCWGLRHAIERPHLHPTEKTQMKASQALGFL